MFLNYLSKQILVLHAQWVKSEELFTFLIVSCKLQGSLSLTAGKEIC